MNRTSLVIDDQLHNIIKELKVRYVTNSTAYLVKLALTRLHENFLPKNVDVSNRVDADVIPTVNLPGMNERIVKTQMERWQLSAEEYMAIVQKLINDFAASGGQMKNPENLIWKACSRYVHERDIQKRANAAAQTTPSADGSGESIYELQDRLG
jgi:hypothetical protein